MPADVVYAWCAMIEQPFITPYKRRRTGTRYVSKGAMSGKKMRDKSGEEAGCDSAKNQGGVEE